MDEITQVKNSISLKAVLQDAGINLVKGKGKCPFHNDNKPSFSIKNNKYTCFSCGEHGDVIDFVSRYYNLSAFDAAKKIDADYNLGICRDLTAEEIAEFKRKQAERKQKQRYKAEINRLKDIVYRAHCERYKRCQIIIEFCNPIICGINPLYAKAFNELQYLEHWFEEVDLYK